MTGIEPVSSGPQPGILPLNYISIISYCEIVQLAGIEPTTFNWKSNIIPLNYSCMCL